MKDHPRSARINAQLQEELSRVLRAGLLRDPRVYGVDFSVTQVAVAENLSHAHVYISSLFAADTKLAEAVKGLNHGAGVLRRELGRALKMRYVPQLSFVLDTALREGDRLNQLISQAVARDKSLHRDDNAPSDAS